MRILAVDDDPIILQLLTSCLTERDNYHLTCCETAEAALELVQDPKHRFDCFLLDVMLPGIDGIELCEALRNTEACASTPILMITASQEVGLMRRVFRAGATDFITKPLNGIELGARINTAGMLNASLLREQHAQHSLDELTQEMKIRFEEPISLRVDGMSEFLSLENELLRLGTGCYAIDLFSVQVDQMRGVYRTVKAPAFRNSLEQIAKVVVAALEKTSSRLAYAGSGRFIGFNLGRVRLNLDEALKQMNENLAESWDEVASGIPVPPDLLIKPLSEKRLWSAVSASDSLRKNVIVTDPFINVSMDDERELFSRLDQVLSSKD